MLLRLFVIQKWVWFSLNWVVKMIGAVWKGLNNANYEAVS